MKLSRQNGGVLIFKLFDRRWFGLIAREHRGTDFASDLFGADHRVRTLSSLRCDSSIGSLRF